MKKNIIIAVLSLIILCGSIVIVTSRMSSTAQEIVSGAIAATSQLQNFEAEFTSHIEQRNTETENIISITEKIDIIYFSSPHKSMAKSTVTTVGVEQNQDEEFKMNNIRYSTVDSDTNDFVMYSLFTGTGINDNANEWAIRRYPMDFQSAFTTMYKENSMCSDIEFCLRSAGNFEKNGEEKIREYNTVRLTGKITGNKISETAGKFVTNDSEIMARAAEEIESVDVEFWIDKKSYNVVKYAVDFTEIYKIMYEKIFSKGENPGDVEIIIGKLIHESVVFNFNQAADFEIPQEALDAQAQQNSYSVPEG